MSFFETLFHTKKSESVVLIDIGSGSVGGAYAVLQEGSPPAVCYTCRIPLQQREGGVPQVSDLSQAIKDVAHLLVTRGAAELRREVGSGSVRRAVVSVASPWQETSVRTERKQEGKPFTFTKSVLHELIARSAGIPEGRISTGESVIATILNGYDIAEPFGKRTNRAEAVILSESVTESTIECAQQVLREAFHLHEIVFTAFPPLAYSVFRDVYPHENDYILLDVAGSALDIALIKQRLLTTITTVPLGVNDLLRGFKKGTVTKKNTTDHSRVTLQLLTDERPDATFHFAKEALVNGLQEALRNMAHEQALPRTIFLLADEGERDYLQHLLADSSLRSLWLSEAPLSILPVVPMHFSPYVRMTAAAHPDVFLMLLALFLRKRIETI